MKTEIKITNKCIFTVEFDPKDYFLVYSNNDPTIYNGSGEELYREYTLNLKIDRSYKGKDPDVGMPVLFLDVEEGEKLKEYFDFVEYPVNLETNHG